MLKNSKKQKSSDWSDIWSIFQPIVQAGGTYVYRPDISKDEAKSVWFSDEFATFVARLEGGEIVGAYVIRSGHRDLGFSYSQCCLYCSRKNIAAKVMVSHWVNILSSRQDDLDIRQYNLIM